MTKFEFGISPDLLRFASDNEITLKFHLSNEGIDISAAKFWFQQETCLRFKTELLFQQSKLH